MQLQFTLFPTKRCKDCNLEKPLDDFALCRSNKRDGRQPRCRACDAIRKAAYRTAHPEVARAYNQRNREKLNAWHASRRRDPTKREAILAREREAERRRREAKRTKPKHGTVRIEMTCQSCGAHFLVKPAQIHRRFCSQACWGAFLRSRPERTCVWCGTTYRSGNDRFCSRQCWRNHQRANPQQPSPETRAKNSAAHRGQVGLRGEANPVYRHGKYARRDMVCIVCGKTFRGKEGSSCCSRACMNASQSQRLATLYASEKGREIKRRLSARLAKAGNPRWRDGASLTPYAPGFTKHIKERVRGRDGGLCQRCGASPNGVRQFPVHHIDWSKANHAMDNLVTLCPKCHTHVHVNEIDASVYLASK